MGIEVTVIEDKSESTQQSSPTKRSQTKKNLLPQKVSKKARESAQLDIGQRIYRAMGSVIGSIKVGKVNSATELNSQRKFHLSIEVNFDLTTGQFEFVELAVESVRRSSRSTPANPPKKSKKAPQKFNLNPPRVSKNRANSHNDELANITRERLLTILASVEKLPIQMVDRIELIESKSLEMFGSKISRNTLYKSIYKPLWQKTDSAKLETDPPD